MDKRLFHPKFLDSLFGFFTSECTIQGKTVNEAASGENKEEWDDKFTAIPCAFGKESGSENRDQEYTYHRARHKIILKGLYWNISGEMRATVDGMPYNILYPIYDYRLQKTTLVVELIEV